MTKEDLLRELLSVINDIEVYKVIEGDNDMIIKELNKKKKCIEKKLIEIGG